MKDFGLKVGDIVVWNSVPGRTEYRILEIIRGRGGKYATLALRGARGRRVFAILLLRELRKVP